MSHHLLHHLYNGIYDAKKEYDVALVVFIIVVHACIISLRSSFNFIIMKYLGENDKIEVLRWIIYGTLLDCIREFVYYKYTILYKTRIQLSLKQYFIKKYLNLLLLESNHDWLNVNKSSEINTAININERQVAIAAPIIPKEGISKKFSTILVIAPNPRIHATQLDFSIK